MLVLGIETTCDETGAAVVRNGREILSNIVTSQIDLHNEYGGVVPELACRRHIDVIIPVIDRALQEAKVSLKDIDLIAVAHGPGLVGALLIGLNAAKALAFSLSKPLIGVNHIEAHLYAALMSHQNPISFPCLGVVLSGGHTSLMHMNGLGNYTLIGQTVDDAVGEAFDKVAKILGLPYPGGPQIEALARDGDPKRFSFRSGQVKGRPFAFSFSGLKTAVLYAAQKRVNDEDKKHVAASFQHAAFVDIVNKALFAAEQYQCKTLIFGGGVTNNKRIKEMFQERDLEKKYLWPTCGLSLDNAAMIAGLGYQHYVQRGCKGDALDLEAKSRIST
jgi:N6-L-threonylcarbamoyladenine synthase